LNILETASRLLPSAPTRIDEGVFAGGVAMSTTRHNPFTPALDQDLPLERRWAFPGFDEKREYARWRAACDLWLLDLEGLTVVRCQTDDISQGGLHATIPIGYGLAVGQRYELRIRPNGEGRDAASPGWTACYGTVIRTRLLTDGKKDRLGFALRFDMPQPVSAH
jgi:hypothetical protein